MITITENNGVYVLRGGVQNKLFEERLKNTSPVVKQGRSCAYTNLFSLWGEKNTLSSHKIDSVYRTLSPALQSHRIRRLLKSCIRSDSMKQAITLMQNDSSGNVVRITFPSSNYIRLFCMNN